MNLWPDKFPLFPEAATSMAAEIDRIYFAFLGISAFFSLLIAGLVFYLAIRYRRRSADEVGKPEQAATWLEVAWSVIPLAILIAMFFWGTRIYFEARRPPADAVEYYVTGKQWMWKFQHPEGLREINHLHVPAGQAIKLIMTSEDVIHSVFVPAFRVKMDVLPGRYTTLWFKAEKTGTFRLFCNEYCGVEHSKMIGSVTVLEPAGYEAWLAGAGGGAAAGAVAATGEQLFAEKICNTCHKPDSATLAPILTGIFGKEIELEGGGVAVADETYFRESILNPGAKIVKGYQNLMPTYQGQLSEDELVQLILYVKSLSAGPATAATAETAAGGPAPKEGPSP